MTDEEKEKVPREEDADVQAEETAERIKALMEDKVPGWADMPSWKEFWKGLKAPRSSKEYKHSILALARLKAPFIAILLPIVSVIALIVITATVQKDREIVQLDIATLQNDETPLEDEPDEVPEDAPDIVAVDPDATVMDVSVDIPAMPSAEISAAPSVVGVNKAAVQSITSPAKANFVFTGGPKMQHLGEGNSFGIKLNGSGAGGGGVPPGYMIGEMFDFKRNSEGEARAADYWNDARKLINDGDFGEDAEKHVYKLDARVALNKIWIPTQPAQNGPEAFGVADKMKPSGWMAHYRAIVEPVADGRFRFVGYFDDFMACLVDGKVVMECNWGNCGGAPGAVTGWKSPEGNSPWGIHVIGDWFDLKKGDKVRIDICVGERPGGLIGGLLLMQEYGKKYDEANGLPVLPFFSSRRLSMKELNQIEEANKEGGFTNQSGKKFQVLGEVSSLFKVKEDDGSVKNKKKDTKKKKVIDEDVQYDVDI
jgi:hypothetical protein